MISKRAVNRLTAAGLLCSGLLAWGMGGYFALHPRPKAAVVADVARDAPCRLAAQQLGFEASPLPGGGLRMQQSLAQDQLAQMQAASLLLRECGLHLQTFCMGKACPNQGVSFTMAPVAAPLPPSHRLFGRD